MPKVFSTWVITLRPGVTEGEFEQFLREWDPAAPLPGTRPRILKGERGEGLGKYLMLNEFESVETRDRYFPSRNQASKEAEELMQSKSFQALVSFIGEREDADWVVLLE